MTCSTCNSLGNSITFSLRCFTKKTITTKPFGTFDPPIRDLLNALFKLDIGLSDACLNKMAITLFQSELFAYTDIFENYLLIGQ